MPSRLVSQRAATAVPSVGRSQSRFQMKFNRVIRSVCLAGAFAALCVILSAVGALITLAAGVISLAVMSRRDSSGAAGFSEYPLWLLCIISFGAATLVLSPLADLPAVWIALCILSPLLGTMIYTVERATSRPTPHAR